MELFTHSAACSHTATYIHYASLQVAAPQTPSEAYWQPFAQICCTHQCPEPASSEVPVDVPPAGLFASLTSHLGPSSFCVLLGTERTGLTLKLMVSEKTHVPVQVRWGAGGKSRVPGEDWTCLKKVMRCLRRMSWMRSVRAGWSGKADS